MSSAFSARRRADQFDTLVGTPTAGVDDARFAELLEVVGALRAVPSPTPRPDFSASLRERLMAEADTVLLPRDRSVEERLALVRPDRPARSRRDRRLAVAAGTLAVVGATTSMAMAAQTALPGDALYPVKRALEDAHAGVSVGDGAKGAALLANASGRLAELGELARLDTAASDAAVPGTLDSFVEQAQDAAGLLLDDYTESGDPESISELRDFTALSMAALGELGPLLPDSARDELRTAAQTIAEIDALAARLCPTCGGSGVTQVPLSLLGAASTAIDDLASPVRGRDRTGRNGSADASAGARKPGRPAAQQSPAEQVGTGSSPFGPGSVFNPSPSGAGTGSTDGTGSTGGSGDRTGSSRDGGLDALLGQGGSTGTANSDSPLDPVLEPLAPVLEPLVESVDDAVDDAVGPSLGD